MFKICSTITEEMFTSDRHILEQFNTVKGKFSNPENQVSISTPLRLWKYQYNSHISSCIDSFMTRFPC